MNEPRVPVEPRDSPYFGLDYYDEKYGAWFFGREAEGGKVITNLRAARLTLLHAESGVGKSSLLRAGVAWRIRRLADDMLARHRPVRSIPVVFSAWKDDPVVELMASVRTAIGPYLDGHPAPELPDDRLDATLEAASGAVNANLLIMLDQFEEYFLYRSREPVPERFADELARCINRTDLRANFLIAIREDAYAGLGDLFKGRIANVYGNYLHIDYLDRASGEKAIREPIEVYNSQRDPAEQVSLQDDLVEAVLDQVRAFGNEADVPGQVAAVNGGGRDRIATPLLQLVMERVWDQERTEGSRELRLATLQKLRGVRMIVDAHLGKALSSLSSDERQTAIDMFDHLVTPSGGKIAESVSDLAKRTGHSEEQVGSVLDKLDHERIVRPIPAAPGQDPMRFRRYEIFHDVLAPTINRAIAAREEQRHVRRIRRFAALAAALVIVMAAVAAVFAALLSSADNAKLAANTEKLTAESRELAAEADLNVGHDPELSTLLALQALHLRSTSQADEALRAALPGLQTVRAFQDGSTVYSAAFDPADNNLVASADFAGISWIWNVDTGQRLVRMSLGGFSSSGTADTVAFNPSGTEVAVGYGDGGVAVFDAHSGRELEHATVGSLVNNLAFLGNTGELAITSLKSLVLWPYQKGSRCCDVLSSQMAGSIATDPLNPQEFAVTTANGAVIWNVSGSGKPGQRQLGTAIINDVEFSPNGKQVVVANDDGTVDIYDLSDSTVVTTLSASEADALTAAFSPNGKQIVAGYSSGTARVWDVSTGLQLTLLAGNASNINAAQFNANGSEVVTASGDGTIRVWYAQPRELQTEFTSSVNGGTPNPMAGAEYIGDRVIALDDYENVAVFTPGGKQQTVIGPDGSVQAVDWDRAGTKIVTDTSGGTVDLWQADGSSYAPVSLPTPIRLNQATGDVAMSPDGSRFALVTNDNFTVQVRSTDTGQVLQTLNAENPIQVVAFSPNEHQVVGGDFYGQAEVWNGAATKPRLLGTPSPLMVDIRYNQTGSEFVTASQDGTVNVWDARDDKLLNSINACQASNTAAFSPDGSKIVVACGDGSVRVFDAATGQTLTVLQATIAGVVTDAAFSPDGNSIVTSIDGGSTGCVQVWSAELATRSLPALERLAEKRVTQKLTAAQQQEYLANGSG